MLLFLKALFIVIEVLCCLLLTGLILLQRSKSEGLGLAFGAGTGESLFGARAGNVLSKATVILGITFMASTLILGILFAQQGKAHDVIDSHPGQPAAVQSLPMEGIDLGVPSVEPAAASEEALPMETTDESM